MDERKLIEYLHYIYKEDLCDLSNLEEANKWKERRGKKQELNISKPVISIMMCVYNNVSLFNAAITSLFKQSFTEWELIILDNSDRNKEAWTVIKNAEKIDSRIRAYKSDRNVGWAKGASVCLKYAKGEYATFLSADDCIDFCLGGLESVNKAIQEEGHPDVLWVGNMVAKYYGFNKDMVMESINVPPYAYFGEKNRTEAILKILCMVYYNSFFHYMRIDFLKHHNIDFFDPYYGDCGGMTKCMVSAQKMVMVNQAIYCLTLNTSQTSGWYIWNFYHLISMQWSLIRKVFVKEGYVDNAGVNFAARVLWGNLIDNIPWLCQGRCRDKYMNEVVKEKTEIIEELQEILEDNAIIELMEIVGRQQCFEKLLESMGRLEIKEEDGYVGNSWLKNMILISQKHMRSNDDVVYRTMGFVLEEKNRSCMGLEYFVEMLESCQESMVVKMLEGMQEALEKYEKYLKWLKNDTWLDCVFGNMHDIEVDKH